MQDFFFFSSMLDGLLRLPPGRGLPAKKKQLVKLNKLRLKSLRRATVLRLPWTMYILEHMHKHAHTHENKTQEPQRCNTNYIFHTMSTICGTKQDQKPWIRRNWVHLTDAWTIQNSENAETVLDHQLRVRFTQSLLIADRLRRHSLASELTDCCL